MKPFTTLLWNPKIQYLVALLHSRGTSCCSPSKGLHIYYHYAFRQIVSPRRLFCSSNTLHRKQNIRKPIIYEKSKKELVNIWKNMTVSELAVATKKTIDETLDLLDYVHSNGMYNKNSVLRNIKVVEKAIGFTNKRFIIIRQEDDNKGVENLDAFKRPPAPESELRPRPPVVTIMGHVDHGKTTLLDLLRKSSIVDSEFGGITQHIGAFSVKLPSGEMVTFLDTPGHAAFKSMRARGANVTDLVVLVVAAEDGVMPQTEESIALAKGSNVPIIVAINKIDKHDADVPACKRMLLQAGLQLEEQGGDVQTVGISALKNINVDTLVESLVAQAEILSMKSDPKGLVEATIIESKKGAGLGKLATCLVQRGTLKIGAYLVAGEAWAKVKNIYDDRGRSQKEVPPGVAAQVIGWKEVPSAGEEVLGVESEKRAKQVVAWREQQRKTQKSTSDFDVIQETREQERAIYRAALDDRLSKGFRRSSNRDRPLLEKMMKQDPNPRISLVLKGDVAGSVEAILEVLVTYYSTVCPLYVISHGVGPVIENDVTLATCFKGGCIYAFNTTSSKDIDALAEENNIPINHFNIIYRLVEKLKDDISSLLPPLSVEVVVGEASVQEQFIVNDRRKAVAVAGCRCTKGLLKKDSHFKLVRGDDVIHKGALQEMRQLKSQVTSIKKGVECGLRFEEESLRFEPGDNIVCFELEERHQRTDWSPAGF